MWGKILFVLLESGSYIQHHGESKVSSIFREKTSFGFTKYNGILSVFVDNIFHGKLVEDCGYQKVLFNPMVWQEADIIRLIIINDVLWSGIRWIGEIIGFGTGV